MAKKQKYVYHTIYSLGVTESVYRYLQEMKRQHGYTYRETFNAAVETLQEISMKITKEKEINQEESGSNVINFRPKELG